MTTEKLILFISVTVCEINYPRFPLVFIPNILSYPSSLCSLLISERPCLYHTLSDTRARTHARTHKGHHVQCFPAGPDLTVPSGVI